MHVAYQILSIVGRDVWPRKAFGSEADWNDLVLASMSVYDGNGREDNEYAFIVILFEFGGVEGAEFRPCCVFDQLRNGIMMCMMIWKTLHWLFIINIMWSTAIIDRTRNKEFYYDWSLFVLSFLSKLRSKNFKKQAKCILTNHLSWSIASQSSLLPLFFPSQRSNSLSLYLRPII